MLAAGSVFVKSGLCEINLEYLFEIKQQPCVASGIRSLKEGETNLWSLAISLLATANA